MVWKYQVHFTMYIYKEILLLLPYKYGTLPQGFGFILSWTTGILFSQAFYITVKEKSSEFHSS